MRPRLSFLLFLFRLLHSYFSPRNLKILINLGNSQLSHNVAKFRFALPKSTSVLGLPIGQHARVRIAKVKRLYTPTTLDTDVGYFELVIKMYPQGRMSHHFREMKEGDYLAVKGPKGWFKYRPGDVRAFGMIAGSLQCFSSFVASVARAILEDESDKTKLDLIYASVTVDDILLKAKLDTLATKYYGRFKVYYVLNQPPEGWTGGVGFVTKEMIEEHLPGPAFDIKILRCGPPPMNKAMASHLEALGYEPKAVFQF
ncbi:hypothetical protein L1987_04431 [Smallanthus sonchifolius]|uniref:Uncharacterized protein n=1 Tax=Smallanthus sonchifolius TaxID=185202 RepID=A0ACB9KDI0_9ASTR|nr:hypothetical protein L1987_04431 [Smallanthus sonchifolius]